VIQAFMLFNARIHAQSHRFITATAPHLPGSSQVRGSQFFPEKRA
jgi:hypothetical protein